MLPRQTCLLFTTTLSYEEFPNGPKYLDDQINGGLLFDKLVLNRLNIFMTHQQNYGNVDRLALYTFDKLFQLVKKWTNFRYRQPEMEDIVTEYFNWYPEERVRL